MIINYHIIFTIMIDNDGIEASKEKDKMKPIKKASEMSVQE